MPYSARWRSGVLKMASTLRGERSWASSFFSSSVASMLRSCQRWCWRRDGAVELTGLVSVGP